MRRLGVLAVLLAGCTDVKAPLPISSIEAPVEVEPGSYDALLAGSSAGDARESTQLVDTMLHEALDGLPTDADERTQVLRLNWFVHAHFESLDPEPFSILAMLRNRSAQCGGSSLALQLLARRLGFATRTAGFFGIPNQGGHTVAEVKWNGRWHFLDPTFGVFVSADGTLDGEIVSFDTLLRYREALADNVFYAVSDGRLGAAYGGPTPAKLSEAYARTQTVMADLGTYRDFLTKLAAATVYASPQKRLIAPYTFDLSASDESALGSRDDSSDDIALHMLPPYDYDATGLAFLGDHAGSYGPLIGEHHYTVAGVAPGEEIRFEMGIVSGRAEEIRIDVRKAELLATTAAGALLTKRYKALRDGFELHVRTPADNPVVLDYLRFAR